MLIITNEWIDIIEIDHNNNRIKRKTNMDSGKYTILFDNNKLIIHWDKWGDETFNKKDDNIYYNCINNSFEILLESKLWNDTCIFNLLDMTVKRKHDDKYTGIFYFIDFKLYITWDIYGLEIFNHSFYGKIYTNLIDNYNNIHDKKDIKMIAILFPQFHEIPENNEFWGKGFTEWTLLKNIPRIVNGQIIKQPHEDIGYFNLTDYNHRKYIRVLADKYNIYGFCFYHYWFKNKKVMYEPTELMLLDGEPNKPFVFCWANEQWTKRWDGGINEILIKQEYCEKGNIEHFYYLLPFFKHNNYMKKCNKPIFIFYRIEKHDKNDIINIINLWNELAIKEGFIDGIHFMRFLGPFDNSINIENINGYIEFQPGYATSLNYTEIISEDKNKIFDDIDGVYNEDIYLNKNDDIKKSILSGDIENGYENYTKISDNERKFRTSQFYVYDGIKMYNTILNNNKIFNEQHCGISLNWNNTPRRNYKNKQYNKYPHYYTNITPTIYGNYLYKLFDKINKNPNKDIDYIFISSWNEWNEQCMLEPNNEDGYNYLKMTSYQYLKYYDFPKKLNILNISHIGGGTEKYMNDLKNIFIEYNFIDFNIYDYYNDNLYIDLYKNIDIIHINSILFNGLSKYYIHFLNTCFKYSNTKIFLTIHDYQWLFFNDPNIKKEDFNKELKILNTNNINNTKHILFKKLLDRVTLIIFPSNNIFNNYNLIINLNKYKHKIHIVNHCDKLIKYNLLYNINNYKVRHINIAYIGYYVDYKGANIFNELSNNIEYIYNKQIYIIRYHVFGNIHNDFKNYNSNILFHNEYKDNKIIEQLHKNNINGIVYLSLFEETYCYSLTNAINSGLSIFYLNRGSIGERLNNKNKCKFIGVNDLNDIQIKFKEFIEYNIKLYVEYDKLIKNNIYEEYHKIDDTIQPNKWYLENYL